MIAITREVSPCIARCELTHLFRQPIDWHRARQQHENYEDQLRSLGCEIHRLPPAPELPDAVFVEDTAVVVDELAVVARPGAASRRPETASMATALAEYRPLSHIEPPGMLDGGDVLVAGRSIFVGRSGRTNEAGIQQLHDLLTAFGYRLTVVPVKGCLHLKTAVTDIADQTLLINPLWVDPALFAGFAQIEVDPAEPFAANALRVGGTLVYAAEWVRTRQRLEARGLRVAAVDVSELAKAEAGVTCCCVIVNG